MRLGRAFWRFAMVASLAVAVTLPVMAQARFGGPGSEASLPDGASSSTSPSTSTPDPGSIVIQPEIPERGTTSSAAPIPGGALQIGGAAGQTVPWSIVVLLTGLTLIPSILLCVTPFARLLIVFHFLRQALGLQTTPSNQTLIGLSLILTFFIMQPVGVQIYHDRSRADAGRPDYRHGSR
jgi:flagellar biosynthetic protein FliP